MYSLKQRKVCKSIKYEVQYKYIEYIRQLTTRRLISYDSDGWTAWPGGTGIERDWDVGINVVVSNLVGLQTYINNLLTF